MWVLKTVARGDGAKGLLLGDDQVGRHSVSTVGSKKLPPNLYVDGGRRARRW
jgi:hypothetical protein